MVVAIYGKAVETEYLPSLGELFNQLVEHNVEVWVYRPFMEYLLETFSAKLPDFEVFNTGSDINGKANILISIGGDGTFLDSVSFVRSSGLPIMGINFGRLGFLANIAIPDMHNAIDLLIAGRFKVEHRSMLEVVSTLEQFNTFPFGLNDFTMQKASSGFLKVNAYVNGEYLCAYWADGLIVSTPTGSTAYSLSVGGPIVSPNLSVLILSAIAPHNLTVRPLVISDDNILLLEAVGRDGSVMLSLDSRSITCKSPVTVTVKKAPFFANVVSMEGSNFYHTLRGKLLWGMDKRN